jgi:hypothetical protein
MKWTLKLGSLTTTERTTLNAFLREVRKSPFLFHDKQDCDVAGEEIGTGDGIETHFYLKHKNIAAGGKFYADTVLLDEGVDYDINQDSGILSFLAGHVPGAGIGASITGDYSWYYKVWKPGDSRTDISKSATAHESSIEIAEFWP